MLDHWELNVYEKGLYDIAFDSVSGKTYFQLAKDWQELWSDFYADSGMYNNTVVQYLRNLEYVESDFINSNGGINVYGVNYDEFKSILSQIFCLDAGDAKYDPADALAARIAEKLKKRKEKLENLKQGDSQRINIFGLFISTLAVGLQKDMNDLLNYTVYQIRDEYKRFQLKYIFDQNFSARLAGAQDLEEVSNWMEDYTSLKI